MQNSRKIAISVICEIINRGLTPKAAIESVSEALDRRDRAFLHEIVYGVLRYRGLLDWVMNHFLKKTTNLSAFTINNLRSALYQLYFMRVPEHAVVYEAVEIEKRKGKPSLVNAVIRNFLRNRDKFSLPIRFSDPLKEISINTSHPEWMIKRWAKRFGLDEARSFAEANNRIAPFTIRTNTLKISRSELIEKLASKGIVAFPTEFSLDGISLPETFSYTDISEFKSFFMVQDEASQLIAYLVAPEPGERVLDACAAPGGKTTHIAQIMGDEGEIIAVEKECHRIKMLEENLKNMGVKSVKVINADLNDLNPDNIGYFDRILVDAPCSSIGVIRKNPDVKYRCTLESLVENSKKQLKLLLSASRFLRDDGLLVYSVCSTEPEECEKVSYAFLDLCREFYIKKDIKDNLMTFIENNFFRTYPHRHNMDGFFGVVFCRKK